MYAILTDFVTTHIRGEKSRAFIQQLCTQNVLTPEKHLFYSAFLNTQGRVIFDAYITFYDDEAYLIHPRCMIPHVIEHLQRYAPFSKVTLHSTLSPWYALPNNPEGHILPHMPYTLTLSCPENYAPQDAWYHTEITHGIPRIRHNHSGLWTAHMLNMDKVHAISYQKGCYLGQEITHRTAHKGQVKKGLYRGPTIPSDDLFVHQPLISSVHPDGLSLYVLEHQDATRYPALTRVYP